jgi:hypothetical protein
MQYLHTRIGAVLLCAYQLVAELLGPFLVKAIGPRFFYECLNACVYAFVRLTVCMFMSACEQSGVVSTYVHTGVCVCVCVCVCKDVHEKRFACTYVYVRMHVY